MKQESRDRGHRTAPGSEPAANTTLGALLWRRRVALLTSVLVLVVLLLPGETVTTVGLWLRDTLGLKTAALQEPGWGDKLVHASLFTVWAFTLQRGWPAASMPRLCLLVLLAAALTELCQGLVPGRAPDVMDSVADVIGGVLGLAIARPLRTVCSD